MLIKNKGGFTILELLLVLFLLGIIFAMSASAYNSWQKQVTLTSTRDEIRSALVRAQQLSVAVSDDNTWGLHLEEDAYVLFKGNYYNASDPANKTWNLHGIIIENPEESFADGAGGHGPDVVFTKLTGLTPNYGTISLVSIADTGYRKNIEVGSSGQIN